MKKPNPQHLTISLWKFQRGTVEGQAWAPRSGSRIVATQFGRSRALGRRLGAGLSRIKMTAGVLY